MELEPEMVLSDQLKSPLDHAKVVSNELTDATNLSDLVRTYAKLPQSNPLKKKIARTLQRHPNKSELHQQLAECMDLLVTGNAKPYDLSLYIIGCSENTRNIEKVLEKCQQNIVEYLSDHLYEDYCTSTVSIDQISIESEKIHVIVRAVILAISLTRNNLTNELARSLLHCCNRIVGSKFVQMELKNNVGILIVLLLQYSQQHTLDYILDSTLTNNFQTNLFLANHLDLATIHTKTLILWGVISRMAKTQSRIDPDQLNNLVDYLQSTFDTYNGSGACVDFLLTVCRTMEIVSKLAHTALYAHASQFIVFGLNCLNHNLEKVRYIAKDIIANTLQQYKRSKDYTDILKAILHASANRNERYICLPILVKEVKWAELVEIEPNLVQQTLIALNNTSLATNAKSSYSAFLITYLNELGEDTWTSTFVNPLLESHDLTHAELLKVAINLCPKILSKFLARLEQSSKLGTLESTTHSIIVLSGLTTLKKNGQLSAIELIRNENCDSVEFWRGILPIDLMKNYIISDNDEIRIAAISLITENHKTTECFDVHELALIEHFFRYNLNSQNAAIRQKIVAIMKKIVQRVDNSFFAAARDHDSYTIDNYRGFYINLHAIFFENLFSFANHNRRQITLELLSLLRVSYTKVVANEKHTCARIFGDEHTAHALLDCITYDTFERNRSLALDLLISDHTSEHIGLKTTMDACASLVACLNLAASVNPTDSQTAAYLFRVYASYPITLTFLTQHFHIVNTPNSFDSTNKSQQLNTCIYLTIKCLHVELVHEISLAQTSLSTAAASKPMHGVLYNIRNLYEMIDTHHTHALNRNGIDRINGVNWNNLNSELINISRDLIELVAPIVTGASPEGFLPMDKITTKDSIPAGHVTSQMILVCAWRTIKEISLLFGAIVEKGHFLEYASDNEDSFQEANLGLLVTADQVKVICEYFVRMLLETRHRGAFEQTYVGFLKYSERMWKCNNQSNLAAYHPKQCLDEIMQWIKEPNDEKNLCATRRSAGIPFVVQAIIVTELRVHGFATCFDDVMRDLFELAACDDTSVHAMNILRALFRHHELNELCVKFIERGVIVAIGNCDSNNWAIRNAATLLFSCLMVRIFGVPRMRDTLATRNKMTFKVFVARFGQLYANIVASTIRPTIGNSKSERYKLSIFPALLILSRLYPSTFESEDRQIECAKSVIEPCLGDKLLKTRELSAKALASLLGPIEGAQKIGTFVDQLAKNNLPTNLVHGILLAIHQIIPNLIEPNYALWQLDRIFWIYETKCCPLMDVLNKVLIALVNKSSSNAIIALIERAVRLQKLAKTDMIASKNYLPTKIQLELLNVIYSTTIKSDKKAEMILDLLLLRGSVDAFKLDLILVILNDENENIYAELDIDDKNRFIFDTHCDTLLRSEIRRAFLDQQSDANELICELRQIFSSPVLLLQENVQYRMLLIAGYYLLNDVNVFVSSNLHDLLGTLMDVLDDTSPSQSLSAHDHFLASLNLTNDNISACLLFCLICVLKRININEVNFGHEVTRLSVVLFTCSSYEQPFLYRQLVAEIFVEKRREFLVENKNYGALCLNWITILRLAQDNEASIRRICAKILECPYNSEYSNEQIVKLMVTTLKKISTEICLSVFLYIFLRNPNTEEESCENNTSDDFDEIKLFDKGEVNTYAEEFKVADLCHKPFRDLLKANEFNWTVIKSILEGRQCDWFPDDAKFYKQALIHTRIDKFFDNYLNCLRKSNQDYLMFNKLQLMWNILKECDC